MSIGFIIWILFLHWIFDFVLQTNKMALNKSKSFSALLDHCLVYSLWAFCVGLSFSNAWTLYSLLLWSHFIIDGITSRITSYLWKKEKRHWFFVTIGLDQFIHYATIFWFTLKITKGIV